MRRIILLVFTLQASLASAQFDGMSDRQKVEYINKNFYSLYSASLANALELTRWAAETSANNNWKQEEAYAQMSWGVVTYLGGDFANVLPKYMRSLSLFESLNDKKGIAAVSNEMGVFYSRQNDLDNSFKCLDRAEQLAREINDLERLGTSLGIRGAILMKHKKFKESEPYFLEVYEIRKKTNDSVGLGYVLLDLSKMAARNGKLDEAVGFIDQSTEIRTRINDVSGLAVNAIEKGDLYHSIGREDDALRWFREGADLADGIGYTDLSREVHEKLARQYKLRKNFEQAYLHLERFDVLKDSLLTKEKVRAIQELQTRYETEKKELLLAEQELELQQTRFLIAFLVVLLALIAMIVWFWRRQEIARRYRMQADHDRNLQEQLTRAVIELQEKERARFALDLHDGLGQLISSVRMQVNRSQEAWTGQAVGLLDQMHQEIRNIAFALLPHTLVTQGLGKALREFAGRLSDPDQMTIHVDESESEGRLDHKIEVSMYRVCQEWINNVTKYAAAREVHITLLIQADGKATLTLEDDGAGFDPHQLELGKGNGWRNIQSRVRLHHGTVYVDSMPGKRGTTLVIDIPAELRQQVA